MFPHFVVAFDLCVLTHTHTRTYIDGVKLKEKASKTVENFLIYRLSFDAEATAALAKPPQEENIIMLKNKCHKKHMKYENILKVFLNTLASSRSIHFEEETADGSELYNI